MTSEDLKSFGVVDEVIPEPPGGAHTSPGDAIESIKVVIKQALSELTRVPVDQLLAERLRKYRCMGEFKE